MTSWRSGGDPDDAATEGPRPGDPELIEPPPPPDDQKESRRGVARGCAFELVQTLVLTLIIFFVVQNFVAQPYELRQQSMEHTLEPGEYVLVDKLTPRFGDYNRGDIIVFHPPVGWEDPSKTPFIKRIIGVAGDNLEIRDGAVFVNDKALDEPYLFEDEPTPDVAGRQSWIVPDGEYFVMGDHRGASADSRQFDTIGRDSIIGRAWLRYWPIARFGVVESVDPLPDT
jgi:signal peptidase I